MIQHYEGALGTFDYDDTLWELTSEGNTSPRKEFLKWRGNFHLCDLPKGLKSCDYMFQGLKMSKGFSLGNFDTSEVTSMEGMFNMCEMSSSFSLGNNFDTSKVTNMDNMFSGCIMPRDRFSLGYKFNTINVTTMNSMFAGCDMSDSFTSVKDFNTLNVKDMAWMFARCHFSEDFSLGRFFSASGDCHIAHIFYETDLPANIDISFLKHSSGADNMFGEKDEQ